MEVLMKKTVLILATLLLTQNIAYSKTQKKRTPKMSKDDARELCLTTKGANISNQALNKCVSKAMRTGKV